MAVEKDIIEKVLGQHPARSMDFDSLYQGLMEMVEQRFINRTKKGELELFNYSNSTVFDKNWNLFTLIARGLILAPASKQVIATPFPKFFNFGEVEIWDADKLEGEMLAHEKLDGSLGIVYHHNDEWHCATRGAFASTQAKWGKDWLHNNVDTSKLETGHTYLFEIIYPENRIFIKTLLEFTKSYGLETVAECVETGEVAKTLIELGANYLQGFYFGYPEVNQPWIAKKNTETLLQRNTVKG